VGSIKIVVYALLNTCVFMVERLLASLYSNNIQIS